MSVELPALGESVTEGTVTRWLKQVGDEVSVDEPLLEVSTDKVDTEIPSPVAGVLSEIRVNEDETVEVGSVLAVIGSPGSQPATAPEPEAAPAQSAPAPAPEAPPPAPAPRLHLRLPRLPRPLREASSDGAYVTPIVRKLANEKGVDLSTVKGTGVGGRIRKRDVLAAASAKATRLLPGGSPVHQPRKRPPPCNPTCI